METIESIEKAVDKLISTTTDTLNALKQVKLAMNSTALKPGGGFGDPNNPTTSREITGQHEKDATYHAKKNMVDKIDYLLTKESRALKNSEFFSLIEKVEGPKVAKKMRTAIYTHLSNLVVKGKAIRCMFNNDKKLCFYLKSDWIDNTGEIRTIKEQFYPSPEALAGIEVERLKPENITWSDKPNTNINH